MTIQKEQELDEKTKEALTNFFQKLEQQQEPLGKECEEALANNLWNLYLD